MIDPSAKIDSRKVKLQFMWVNDQWVITVTLELRTAEVLPSQLEGHYLAYKGSTYISAR